MKPLQIAAQFAAYTWYSENRQAPPDITHEEASHFAEDNWQAFLPVADKGLGRLLLRITRRPERERVKGCGQVVQGATR